MRKVKKPEFCFQASLSGDTERKRQQFECRTCWFLSLAGLMSIYTLLSVAPADSFTWYSRSVGGRKEGEQNRGERGGGVISSGI